MRALAVLVGLTLFASGCHPDEWLGPRNRGVDPRECRPHRTRSLSGAHPCANRSPGGRAFFGDLHVHTALSMDTVIRSGISSPDMAYPLRARRGDRTPATRRGRAADPDARGSHVHSTSPPSPITPSGSARRPCARGAGSPVHDTEGCRTFRGESRSWMGEWPLRPALPPLVGLFGRSRELCGPDGLRCRRELSRAWQETRAARRAMVRPHPGLQLHDLSRLGVQRHATAQQGSPERDPA